MTCTNARTGWTTRPRISVPAIHQDQVIVPPSGARVLGGNVFTPYGILSYPQRRAISFQVHPEFETDYATALIAGHRRD